jgi:hypothetical protein
MKKRQQISADEAKRIGESLYIDWGQVDMEKFRQGLMGNHQPGAVDPETEQTYGGLLMTGKLVLAHMQEFPDYFARLAKLKAEADEHQASRR